MERENIIKFVESILPSMKCGETKIFQHNGRNIKVYSFEHATENTVDNEEPFEI